LYLASYHKRLYSPGASVFAEAYSFLINQIPQDNISDQQKDAATILRAVQPEHGFYFMTENGVYSGEMAVSLEDFQSKLETIDVKSVVYHYYRGDFQRWIESTLGDRDFANKLCFISTEISPEGLRLELLKLLDKRITDLKSLSWIENEGI
jgi:hypothetical protein